MVQKWARWKSCRSPGPTRASRTPEMRSNPPARWPQETFDESTPMKSQPIGVLGEEHPPASPTWGGQRACCRAFSRNSVQNNTQSLKQGPPYPKWPRCLGHVGLHHSIASLSEEDQQGHHQLQGLGGGLHVISHVTGQGVYKQDLGRQLTELTYPSMTHHTKHLPGKTVSLTCLRRIPTTSISPMYILAKGVRKVNQCQSKPSC